MEWLVMRRVVCSICGVLLASLICGKPQTSAEPVPQLGPVLVVPAETSIPTGSAMDSLAAKLSAEISARNMTGVVVVGFSGPDRRVTELGKPLRAVFGT